MRFHDALVKRKYRWLFLSKRWRRPGPKGPGPELINAIVEMKRRNPRFGCRRIAQQIALYLASRSKRVLAIIVGRPVAPTARPG